MTTLSFTDAVDRIRGDIDIVDIVARYVVLKRSGRNHTGLCPFHQDKKPSFSVHREKNLFKCFSCGEGGDAFAFLMKIERKTFGEVIHDLADTKGIEIQSSNASGTMGQPTEAYAEKKALKQQLLELNQEASRWFQQNCHDPAGAPALLYFQQRGLSAETLETFKLGYALPGWDHLTTHLFKQLSMVQKAPSLLETAGLASPRKEGGGYYDKFRNRLIIPIHDDSGRVVAFGGRAMSDEDQPKYLNSPETLLYHKSNVLYGLFQAKQAIRDTRSAIVMEGYFDVISAHQAGVTQAVGSCGTALTEAHLKLLARFGAETLYLAFDSDTAGLRAGLQAIQLIEPYLASTDLKIKILTVPNGKDPDGFIRQAGGEAYKALINSAKSHLEFQLDQTLNGLDFNKVDDQVVAAVRLAPLLLKVVHPVHRQLLIQQYAQRIQVPEQSLHLEVQRLLPKNQTLRLGGGNNRPNREKWEKNKEFSRFNKKNEAKQAIFDPALSLMRRSRSSRSEHLVPDSLISEEQHPESFTNLSSQTSSFSAPFPQSHHSGWPVSARLMAAEQALLELILCNEATFRLAAPIVHHMSFVDNVHSTVKQWMEPFDTETAFSQGIQRSHEEVHQKIQQRLSELLQAEDPTPSDPSSNTTGSTLYKAVSAILFSAEQRAKHYQAFTPDILKTKVEKEIQDYTQVIAKEQHQQQLRNLMNQPLAKPSTVRSDSTPSDTLELEAMDCQYRLRDQLAQRGKPA